MPKLLDEANALSEALAVASEYDGFNDDDAELIQTIVEGETDFKAVLSALVERYNDYRAQESAAKELKKKYADRAKSFSKKQDGLKHYIHEAFKAAGIDKQVLPEGTVYTSKSRGGIEVDDDSAIPENYWRVKRSPDKRKLKDALQSGESIPGVRLADDSETLNIRV